MEGQQLRIVTFAPDAQDAEDIEATGSIVWNYYKTDGVRPPIGAMRSISCPPPRPLALSIATAAALSRVGRGAGAQGALGAEKARGQGHGLQPKSRLAHF